MLENLNDAINLLLKTGREQSQAKTVDGGNIPYVLVPEGCKVQPVPELIYNEHAKRPERVKASVKVLDPASFTEYFEKFADDESRVFAYEPSSSVQAILDYHESPDSPRWGQHRVTLELRKSEEWSTWTGANNKPMSQMQFSEFLEQNGMDITDPSPATMMEVARDLEAKSEVEFGGGAKTANGQIRFKYSETTKGTMANGTMEVPEKFTISLPVFVGSNPINMLALLRYRLKDGKLSLFYTLVRPEAVIRESFLAARNAIQEAIGVTILNGMPA